MSATAQDIANTSRGSGSTGSTAGSTSSAGTRGLGYDAEGSAEANLPQGHSALGAAPGVQGRAYEHLAPPRASARAAVTRPDYRISRSGRRAHTAVRGLGWFSIALGLVELLAPHTVARAVGLQGREGLVRLYGLREIATGIGLLTADDPSPWVWGRVAGDALDLATLGTGTHDGNRARPLAGIAAVVGVTAVDLATATGLHIESERQRRPSFDYSDRSGFPQGLSAAAGAAANTKQPRDMRGAESMQQFVGGADDFAAQKQARETEAVV